MRLGSWPHLRLGSLAPLDLELRDTVNLLTTFTCDTQGRMYTTLKARHVGHRDLVSFCHCSGTDICYYNHVFDYLESKPVVYVR